MIIMCYFYPSRKLQDVTSKECNGCVIVSRSSGLSFQRVNSKQWQLLDPYTCGMLHTPWTCQAATCQIGVLEMLTTLRECKIRTHFPYDFGKLFEDPWFSTVDDRYRTSGKEEIVDLRRHKLSEPQQL